MNFSHDLKRLLERLAVALILKQVINNGWFIDYVDDGGYEQCRVGGATRVKFTSRSLSVDPTRANQVQDAVNHIFAVDAAHVFMHRGTEQGYMFFVLGNDPEEVLNDYSANIDCLDHFDVEEALWEEVGPLLKDALKFA